MSTSSCFDCSKVRDRCKGECCGPCPIPVATWHAHQVDIQGEIEHALDDGEGFIHAVTTAGNCPFKSPDGLCVIYPKPGQPDPRADVCRLMGDESHLLMTCRWMDRTGRVRPRWERREVSREIAKAQDRILQQIRASAGRRKT